MARRGKVWQNMTKCGQQARRGVGGGFTRLKGGDLPGGQDGRDLSPSEAQNRPYGRLGLLFSEVVFSMVFWIDFWSKLPPKTFPKSNKN